MENISISKEARKILLQRGIKTLEDLIRHTSRTLNAWGIPLNDLFSLGVALKKRFGQRRLMNTDWSKGALRDLRGDSNLAPPGVKVDEGVIHSFIHRATTGKHYKKPRRKGLF